MMKLTDLQNKLQNEFQIAESKSELVEKFLDLGLPNKKSEAYRYANMDKLFDQEFETLEYNAKELAYSDKILIVNGEVISMPKGIRVYYANTDEQNINLEHYDPLYFLGHLLSKKSIIIEIDGDSEVDILHRITKASTLIHYRIVIKTQVNKHASIYEHFEFDNAHESLLLYGYDVDVQKDSTLTFVKNQHSDEDAPTIIASHDIKVEKQASLTLQSFDFGNAPALQLFNIVLEEHAHVDMGQLLYLWGNVKRGTISKIIHRGESSHSVQEAKNILEGSARGIFDAIIKVEHSAKYTKTQQNSKTILLGEATYMVAKPQLEIYIDELEASHGSTIGQLDIEQLFYLRSRGITEVEARKLLIVAFANKLIGTIRDKRQEELINQNFEKAFYAQNQKTNLL
ncbi:MAG: Iron-sulfur cluster assembly protein SufD [uncultured Sulfurovum sp.]|uniref:Iron-sulfur cluster assembly protein SufD n=1 Tax=uncultured Sulfurovum sp. TaxID=269237 RepID=A0A6S6SQ66_9BACT|nr:MAG: Iron-sulfur cluster assembly protein SufD [uncultured Sulfurovum sp.]